MFKVIHNNQGLIEYLSFERSAIDHLDQPPGQN